MSEKGKTIKQLADEIGVSKQAVYKRYKGKLNTVCAPYAHTINGILYLDETGSSIIIQDFEDSKSIKHSIGAHTNHIRSTPLECSDNPTQTMSIEKNIIDLLQKNIDILHNQLEIKDQQIAQLSEALLIAQKTVSAAQFLHAGTIQKQLKEPIEEKESSPNKKSFWSRFFHK